MATFAGQLCISMRGTIQQPQKQIEKLKAYYSKDFATRIVGYESPESQLSLTLSSDSALNAQALSATLHAVKGQVTTIVDALGIAHKCFISEINTSIARAVAIVGKDTNPAHSYLINANAIVKKVVE